MQELTRSLPSYTADDFILAKVGNQLQVITCT